MSSLTVTPVRRPHDFDDVSDEDTDEPSIDENGSIRSSNNKRTRLERSLPGGDHGSSQSVDDHNTEDLDQDSNRYSASRSPERPLLPDSFLRSPRGRNENSIQQHQPGAIVRVTLTDFVTYTNAEFRPGPNLNMVIGPNGTGKSTLVCAICLGLGWKTQHLGRAKDISEFVKHGERAATIEIELAADPARHRSNPVITTKIMRDSNKAEHCIDGRKVSGKALQELMKSFSIQIDNLCQFLPQDRVVEFAALSPVDLLTHTQKAAAPEEMTIWHEELKTMRREQKGRENRRAELDADIKNLQNRQRLQEADVMRLRERTALQSRFTALEKLRPFPDYSVAKQKHAEGKERKKEAERDLKRLNRRMEPNLKAIDDKKAYKTEIGNARQARTKLVERTHGHISTIQDNHTKFDDQLKDLEKRLRAEKDQAKLHAQEKPRLQGNVQRIEHALKNPPPEFDTVAANVKIQEANREIRDIESKASELKESMDSLVEQARQRGSLLKNLADQREQLKTQAGQQEQKLKSFNSEVAQAWRWMQDNRAKFEGEIYGPALLECSVKDENYAAAVEAAIGGAELLALTVTNQRDFRMLYEQVYTQMKLENVNIRTSTTPLAEFRPPLSSEQMHPLGLECFLIELIEGPDAVLAMLCDNRNLHAHGFTSRAITQAQYEALLSTNLGAWSTPKERNSVARRREYGDQGSSVRSIELKPARFFKDGPVEHHEDSENRRKEAELNDEIRQLKEELTEKKNRIEQLREQCRPIAEKRDALQSEKNARQTMLAQYRGLPVKLEQAQQKLNDVNDKIEDAGEKQLEIIKDIDKTTLLKGQSAIDLANATNQLKGLYSNVLDAEIAFIEAESDVEQLEARHQQENELLQERKDEVHQLTQLVSGLLTRGKELQDQCQAIGNALSVEEHAIYEEIKDWAPDQLETEIQSVQARVEMTGAAGNQHVLREYEERALTLEKRQDQYDKLTERLDTLEQEIGAVRGQWEPQLDHLVGQISSAFADNFAKIQCAGEVAIYKDDDFENWAIQIKVKFRENEQLSILDSHRQSGGERAVSTIFYLMALQSLARAPFRVVDEINQGMDPRNERLVHSRMVDIACAENSASQYFLITPKLLNGLKYHPSMKVHCIASGEYMPEDHRELDFAQLARKALAVRSAQLAASAA